MARAALRASLAIAIDHQTVAACLDDRFTLAWTRSLEALPKAERTGALPAVTGHVAESVVEVILTEHGYVRLWRGPRGVHATAPAAAATDQDQS